jgi:hypothetical protein
MAQPFNEDHVLVDEPQVEQPADELILEDVSVEECDDYDDLSSVN